ncbi:MAG: Sulfate adenylyltransferase [Chaenotheca gracillima]|nr:MAG: Sulfate adenylyltransferase [Chaenotheca gracillima]
MPCVNDQMMVRDVPVEQPELTVYGSNIPRTVAFPYESMPVEVFTLARKLLLMPFLNLLGQRKFRISTHVVNRIVHYHFRSCHSLRSLQRTTDLVNRDFSLTEVEQEVISRAPTRYLSELDRQIVSDVVEWYSKFRPEGIVVLYDLLRIRDAALLQEKPCLQFDSDPLVYKIDIETIREVMKWCAKLGRWFQPTNRNWCDDELWQISIWDAVDVMGETDSDSSEDEDEEEDDQEDGNSEVDTDVQMEETEAGTATAESNLQVDSNEHQGQDFESREEERDDDDEHERTHTGDEIREDETVEIKVVRSESPEIKEEFDDNQPSTSFDNGDLPPVTRLEATTMVDSRLRMMRLR